MKFGLLIFFVFVLTACGKSSSANSQTKTDESFDILCQSFTEFTQSAAFSKLDEHQRFTRFEKRLLEKISPRSNAYVAWTAISATAPEYQYQLYKDAAASVRDDNDWECPAMATYAGAVKP